MTRFLFILISLFSHLISFFAYSEEGNWKAKNHSKPHCVLYGNCQLSFVYEYLKANFPHKYEYHLITNYLVIEGKMSFPVEIAKQADLFIYQPLNGHGEYDTDYIKSNYLKNSCQLISSPYLYFLGYFPDYIQDPRNKDTITPQIPYGIFPYGSQRLIDLITEGKSVPQIIEQSYGDDFIPKNLIFEKLHQSLSILRNKETMTDIKLADFIEHNYQKHHLFYSVNHPTNFLLKAYIKQILRKMNLSTKKIKNNPFFHKEFFTNWTNGIIYPCVAKTLNLEFDISHVTYRDKLVLYPIYIVEYVRCLYSGT